MSLEQPINKDPATLLAERVLGDRKILSALIGGDESRQTIAQQIATEVSGFDPLGQAGFLKILFQNMAREGDAITTDRRDGALEVLKSDALRPIVESNLPVVCHAYLEAIRRQSPANDAFSGSIDTLLEAGKIVTPYLYSDPQAKRWIVEAWEQVVQRLPVAERFHVRSQLQEQDIEASARRLIARGKIEPAPKGRPVNEAVARLDKDVETLRKEGFSNRQIAERLGRKITDIKASVHRLIARGKIEPAPKGRRPRKQA